ncbi:hypothetical protein Slin15195_G126830 [Septoria linicola]|uniref:Uncharacterized protein n=1 Tax=Septoria linicola TaxID=215465 RepID=A0A9Q9B1Q4_9PEZI|nr:hypothetical protein Slin14017_G083000 [Septoria linicola]USW59364.1 hypothetical protein Slin15195_G126830 [Septoria linicola]
MTRFGLSLTALKIGRHYFLPQIMTNAIPTAITMSAKASPTTFLGLPPQLRAEIYIHALVTKDNINLHRRKGRIVGRLCRYNSTLKHDSLGKQFATGLLRASKQVKAETGPLLHGNNVFLVASSDHFAEWIQKIGKNAGAVRLIKLLYASTCHRFFFDTLLSSVPSLSRLEIPYGRLSRVDDTIVHLKRFVVAKVKKGQGSNALSDALSIFAFYDDRDFGCTTSGSGKMVEAYTQQVRMELARLM